MVTQASLRGGGFSLLELLAVVVLVGIVSVGALAPVTSINGATDIRAITYRLTTALTAARAAAGQHLSAVIVCALTVTGDTGCDSTDGDWPSGWFAFVDRDDDGVFDSNEPVVSQFRLPAADMRLFKSAPKAAYRFDHAGFAAGANTSFFVCHPDVDTHWYRISISSTSHRVFRQYRPFVTRCGYGPNVRCHSLTKAEDGDCHDA